MKTLRRWLTPSPKPQAAIPSREAVLGLLAEHEAHCRECVERRTATKLRND